MIVYTKTYHKDTIPQEIKIEKFPVVIFTDSHTNLSNIKKLKELYPNNQFICLGDISFLFAKPGEKFNSYSIQYFIDNKILCLGGNHEEIVKDSEDITCEQSTYLKNLPRGFRLILPDYTNYLCYHHRPSDIWGFSDKQPNQKELLEIYPQINNQTSGVLKGHEHRNFVVDYPEIDTKLIGIGQLCGSNHHTVDKDGGNYALLTENGIQFKKI